MLEDEALGVLPGGEVDDAPILQEAVDPDYQADIPHQQPAAVGSRKVLFHILEPHPHHRVAVVLVQLGVPGCEREGQGLPLGLEELGEGLLLDRVDDIEGKPEGEGRKGEVRGRLNYRAGDQPVLLHPHSRLRGQVGWVC